MTHVPQYDKPESEATQLVRMTVKPKNRSMRNASKSFCHKLSSTVPATGRLSGLVDSICRVDCSLLPGGIASALPTMASAANMSAAPNGIESDAIAVTPPNTSPPLSVRPGNAGEPTE